MRIRTIKPEFWIHEGMCQCSEFTRLLAIALLNWADDEGYFMAHPMILKGNLFPFLDDSTKIPRSLQDLSRIGWVEIQEDSQMRPIGRVLNFLKHQRVDKGKRSLIKDLWPIQDESKIDPRNVEDASKEEGKGIGKEEEGKESRNIETLHFDIPFESLEFRIAWNDWLQHRIEKKKKMTKSTAIMQLKEMKEIGEARAINMINYSIKNGWTGLFEDKTSFVTPIQRKPQTSDQFGI